MGRAEDIQEQRRRLTISRQKLADVLNQIAQQGEAFALPWQTATRREARAEIARIKAVLRDWGEIVDDHPDDLVPAAPPTPSGAATVSVPAALFDQRNTQVHGPVYNVHGTVNVTHVSPPPPAPAYPPSPAPTTPIEAFARPFPFNVRLQVHSMLETYTEIFGGRAAELAQLDAFLHTATPYALLLAPTGRGKTALLIQWAIQVHERGGWQVIFVPISIRYQTAAADVVFRTLALALATIHGEQAQFDGYRQTPDDLRAISADYLRRPPPEGQQVLLVLDGLDEAVGWELRAGLFPRTPPAWLRLVCAARQVAHKTLNDWLRDLDWRKDLVWRVSLAGLDDAAVQDILVCMGNPLDDLATDVDFIKEIGRISAGDPLTIRMLIEALRGGDVEPKKLTAMTPGLEAFMREWLRDIRAKSAENTGIRMLLRLCAVALGPLTSDEVLALAPDSFSDSDVLKETAEVVARVLIGDGSASAGYVLSHPRLREFFLKEGVSRHEREEIQARFVAYGERCYAAYCRDSQAQPIPTYLCQFWVAHLVAAVAWDKARMVLTEVAAVQTRPLQPWAVARYAVEGSYAGYLTDLDRLWGHAEQQQDLVLVIRCALIAASIRSLSGNLSPALLVGLVTVGTPEGTWSVPAAIEHIRQMPNERRQAEAIKALAKSGAVMDMVPLLAAAQGIRDEDGRAWVLAGLAPHLPEGLVSEALVMARGIGDEGARAAALAGLAPHLPEDLVGEALAAARGIGDEGARAAALAGLAPHLPEDLVGEALAAARGIGDEGARAAALAGLAPHLPEDLVGEALAMARGIESERARAAALAGIASRLPEGEQGAVWDEVLVLVRGIESEGGRAVTLVEIVAHLPEGLVSEALALTQGIGSEWARGWALARIAPRLPEGEQGAVWDEVLALVRGNEDEWDRMVTLVQIVAHLPEGLVSEALALVRGIGDEGYRAAALAGIAPHLPEGLVGEALVMAGGIGKERARAQALAGIAPHLPEGLVGEALVMAGGIGKERARAQALEGIAPHLPEGDQGAVWGEALALAQGIGGSGASALVEIAPYLPEGLVSEALVSARGIGDEGGRASALAAIAPHLPEGEQSAVWGEALAAARGIGDEGGRAFALAGLASHLSEGLLSEALALAQGIRDEDGRAWVLAGLAPHLPEGLVSEALVMARGIGDEGYRAAALAGIAPRLPEGEQGAVWDEALALVRGIGNEGGRASALAGLAPYLPEDLVGEALALAQGIRDEEDRASALAGLAPYLPEDLVGEALALAQGIRDEEDRASTLAGLAPHLPEDLVSETVILVRQIKYSWKREKALADLVPKCVSHHFPRATLLPLLRSLAARGRSDLLSDLAALMPWIAALTTPEERVEIFRVVREVAACWP